MKKKLIFVVLVILLAQQNKINSISLKGIGQVVLGTALVAPHAYYYLQNVPAGDFLFNLSANIITLAFCNGLLNFFNKKRAANPQAVPATATVPTAPTPAQFGGGTQNNNTAPVVQPAPVKAKTSLLNMITPSFVKDYSHELTACATVGCLGLVGLYLKLKK